MDMHYRFGRYEALRTIASGGMAEVFEGRVLGAGGFERIVAIKSIHPQLLNDARFVQMFLDEARIAAQIQHPNVVATHDVQREGERLFLVMDYVDGPSLHQALSYSKAPLPISIIIRIYIDALLGLHAAHELRYKDGRPANLVHRDFTPHNILLAKNGAVKIADFGIALADVRLTRTETRTVKGKLSYSAPEQVAGVALDRRADIYTAGIGLWECLTGHKMFPTLPAAEIARRVRYGLLPPLPDSVPKPLSQVIHRALRRDPARRFEGALQFSDALLAAAKMCRIAPATHMDLASYFEQRGLFEKHDRDLERFSNDHPLPRAELRTAHDLELQLVDAHDDSASESSESLGVPNVGELLGAGSASSNSRRPAPSVPPPKPRGYHAKRGPSLPPPSGDRNGNDSPESAPPIEALASSHQPRTLSTAFWAAVALVAALLFVVQLGPDLGSLLEGDPAVQIIDLDESSSPEAAPTTIVDEPLPRSPNGADAGLQLP